MNILQGMRQAKTPQQEKKLLDDKWMKIYKKRRQYKKNKKMNHVSNNHSKWVISFLALHLCLICLCFYNGFCYFMWAFKFFVYL